MTSRRSERRASRTGARINLAALCLLLGLVGASKARAAGQEEAQSPATEAPIQLGPSCVTSDCHGDMAPGPGVHGPLNVGNCQICHEVIDNQHLFQNARQGQALCGLCHQLDLQDVVHAPVVEGDCTGCHDPHRSDIDPLLSKSPTGGLCADCHEEDPMLHAEFLHGPVEAGLCVLCHEAHSSSNVHLVREGSGNLCMFCHGDEIAQMQEMRHIHEPVTADSCLACHDPHGGDSAALTHEASPGLCFTCHDDLKTRVTTATAVHDVDEQGLDCSKCHDAHASPMASLLREGELDLCLSCHEEEVASADGDLIPGVANLIRTSNFLHGPVRNGNCTECHDAHASENFRLLVHDYPPEFYAPYEPERYALCFECHAEGSMVEETTASLTNFRDGNKNLHYVHVVREERGRTCRACHEVHASNLPFHMSDSVPYGGWELPINYEQIRTGGRCSPGCHEPKEYHREAVEIAPLPNPPEGPEGIPAGG
jgi:predicted CXXCH cytochrome family protein